MRHYLAHNPAPALMLKALPRPAAPSLVLSKSYGHDDRLEKNKAKTKTPGQQDLGPIIDALTDTLPGEELKKR